MYIIIVCQRYLVLASLAVLIGLQMPSGISANPSRSLTTLEEYTASAFQNSPEIKSAYEMWQSQVHRSGYAGTLPEPVITFGQFIEQVETRVGPQERKFGLRQTIPWPGTLGSQKAIATRQAEIARRRYEAVVLEVVFRIRKAWYNLYLLNREITLTRGNVSLLSFWESVIETKYSIGLADHPDLIKTQIERLLLENHLANLHNKVNPVQQRLRAILSIDDSIKITIPDSLDVTSFLLPEETALSEGLKHNPDVTAAIEKIDQSQSRVRLSGKSSYPNITIGFDYIQTGPALNPTLPESGKDPWSVSVGVSLPIWFGKNRAKKSEARAMLNSSRHQLTQLENNLQVQISAAYAAKEDASRKIDLYREGIIPQTENLLEVLFSGYESGGTDIYILIDTQRQLLKARLILETARVQLAVTQAQLEMLVGKDLPSNIKEHTQ